MGALLSMSPADTGNPSVVDGSPAFPFDLTRFGLMGTLLRQWMARAGYAPSHDGRNTPPIDVGQ